MTTILTYKVARPSRADAGDIPDRSLETINVELETNLMYPRLRVTCSDRYRGDKNHMVGRQYLTRQAATVREVELPPT